VDGAGVDDGFGGNGVLVTVGDEAGVSVKVVVGVGMSCVGVRKPLAAWLTSWQAIRKSARNGTRRRIANELYLFPESFSKA
jgi:hypothetical protein